MIQSPKKTKKTSPKTYHTLLNGFSSYKTVTGKKMCKPNKHMAAPTFHVTSKAITQDPVDRHLKVVSLKSSRLLACL